MSDYATFLDRKRSHGDDAGFAPLWLPEFLFDFQRLLVEWALRRGCAAIFADCGPGKTPMQLVWSDNVIRRTNKAVLILTPLAVSHQTLREAEKFGLEARRSQDGRAYRGITITNYERLEHFTASDFAGVVCDESSIIKHFSGATQKAVTRFMYQVPYRLLCTATAAPNDYVELGTSSEALGVLGYSDMLSRFFRQSDKQPHRMEQIKEQKQRIGGNYFAKLAFRAAQQIGQWHLKGHAETHFWRWVASWARACRRPSDLGFADDGFVLPPLNEVTHVVTASQPPADMLFTLPAFGLAEERAERRRTLRERCERAASLVRHTDSAIVWVQLNCEGDLLERLIPDSVQIAGADADAVKEERLLAFLAGEARVLITKQKIAGWGLNFQHCAHIVTFVSHSYEAYYQAVRRCWRFGQTRPVRVDIIAAEGEQRVSENIARKAAQMDEMFNRLVTHMHEAVTISREQHGTAVEVPLWLDSEPTRFPEEREEEIP